jgi:hypothetical protein
MSTKPAVRLLLGFTVAMAIGTAMAWHVRGGTPSASTQPAQSAPHTVRVERTLVLVAEPVVERPVVEGPVVERRVIERPVVERPVVEGPVVERPVRSERADIRARSGTAPVSRARRVLFGSGRYRPEPFPRGALLESPPR